MYESSFALDRRPFAATPNPEFYVALEPYESALREVLLCIQGGRGVAVLTGGAGSGKTLLCRQLLRQLGEQFAPIYLPHSNFSTRRALLQAILYELGQPYIRLAAQELRLELATAVRCIRPDREAVVLIVDEAHLLTNRLLDEIRTITTACEDGQPVIRALLSGQPRLEESLTHPSLDALNQRIACQVSLDALTQEQSKAYLAGRLKTAGGQLQEIFTTEAINGIIRAGDGVPRALNQLCDHAMLLAAVGQQTKVDLDIVRAALEDLKKLPLRWNDLPADISQQRVSSAKNFDEIREEDSILGPDTPSEAHTTCLEFGADDDYTQPASIKPADAEESLDVLLDEIAASENDLPERLDRSSAPADATTTDEQIISATLCHGEWSAATAETLAIAPSGDSAWETGESEVLDEAAIHGNDVAAATSPAVQPIPPQPVPPFELVLETDDHSFVEEPVVDRYALLDAGRKLSVGINPPAALNPAATANTTTSAASAPSTSAKEAVSSKEDREVSMKKLENSELDHLDAVLRMVGDDSLSDSRPEQIIDAVLPMFDELLDLSDELGSTGDDGDPISMLLGDDSQDPPHGGDRLDALIDSLQAVLDDRRTLQSQSDEAVTTHDDTEIAELLMDLDANANHLQSERENSLQFDIVQPEGFFRVDTDGHLPQLDGLTGDLRGPYMQQPPAEQRPLIELD